MNKFHKVYHHVRHTRPQWYHDYHRWKHHETLHWATFILSTAVMFVGFINAVILMAQYSNGEAYGATGSTTVTANVQAGLLTLTHQNANVALSSATINVASMPSSSGSIGDITVTDNRGSGAGYSVTASCTSFVKYNNPVRTGGAAGSLAVDATSTFYGLTGGTITVSITGGGALGVATYSISGLDTASGTTGASVTIGGSGAAKGLILQFGAGTYTTSDAWTIKTDVIPANGITITPGSLNTLAGSSTNVTAGSQYTFTSATDSMTLIQASTLGGYGMGQYRVTPNLSVTIPVSTYTNNYSALLTTTTI